MKGVPSPRHSLLWLLIGLAIFLASGCGMDKIDRSSVTRIPQRPFDRERWRSALPDDAYRGRVRYSMYKDVMKRTKPGTSLITALADYGPPNVVLSDTPGESEPLSWREHPPGTQFAMTYYLAQDPEATFGLNLTLCFDKQEKLIKTVEHW